MNIIKISEFQERKIYSQVEDIIHDLVEEELDNIDIENYVSLSAIQEMIQEHLASYLTDYIEDIIENYLEDVIFE